MRTISAFLVSVLAIASPRDLTRVAELPEIARLHTCIQLRFKDRTTFGMRRILPWEYHGIRDFRPENTTEESVIKSLQEQGYEVALYLAGRGVLTVAQASPESALNRWAQRRNLPQGPAFITKIAKVEDLPSGDVLLAAGRAGFAALAKGEAYDVRESGWTIAMRPLRADNTCVRCHASSGAVKSGDALGVAMYVYRLGR